MVGNKFKFGDEVMVQGFSNLFYGKVVKVGLFRVAVYHGVYNEDYDYSYNAVKWFRKGKVFHVEDIPN